MLELSYLWYLIQSFFRSEIVEVYHKDSPGIRLLVRRNWFQRLTYSETFSEIGEQAVVPTFEESYQIRFLPTIPPAETVVVDSPTREERLNNAAPSVSIDRQ